ncbi:hypothetical protein, partial [Aeromonas veronii]|uniref:hypothetical protein n=1 Tax=Aeromonas veronii TaxID=654 RepID=UPI001A90938B
ARIKPFPAQSVNHDGSIKSAFAQQPNEAAIYYPFQSCLPYLLASEHPAGCANMIEIRGSVGPPH